MINSNNNKELFARLFVVALQNKINLAAFTFELSKSEFIKKIEKKEYSCYFDKPLLEIFFDITGNKINSDNSYGVFNDAYWCGYSYFELHQRTQKPFSYIFLKLPLAKMLDIYSVYHEMDFSSLLIYFAKSCKEKTILRLLSENYKVSLNKLSYSTGISLTTLSKYNLDDKYLYKSSFQNIIKISNYFDVPTSLFVERINRKKLNKNFIEIYGDNYLDYYLKTREACRGIIIRDGYILLSHEKHGDTWMIPGGGLEKEESDKDCVIREVSEETGYIVKPSECELEIDEYYGCERYINKYYLCEIAGKTDVKLTKSELEAGLEVAWVSIEKAIKIFSKYQQYFIEEEMKYGLYLREYLALRRIINKK